jgi:hypothetical protein
LHHRSFLSQRLAQQWHPFTKRCGSAIGKYCEH